MRREGRISGGALERIRLSVAGLLSACLLVAIEERLYRLRLPGLPAGGPWLCLLLTLAVGYLFDEEHGAVMGLLGGILLDCVSSGVMLRPLSYLLAGYLAGRLSGVVLSHDMLSFAIFSAGGAVLEGLFRYGRAAVSVGSLSGLLSGLLSALPVWWYEVLPHALWTILLSPLIYLAVGGMKKLLVGK